MHMENLSWQRILPTIILGFKTCLNNDVAGTVAEMVYVISLRLPGDFLCSPNLMQIL